MIEEYYDLKTGVTYPRDNLIIREIDGVNLLCSPAGNVIVIRIR